MDEFERRNDPLLPKEQFAQRQLRFVGCAVILLGVSWLVGIIQYHLLEKMNWWDAILNASMILGGMGPVTELHTPGGKLFASLYAIYCGAILLIAIGIIVAPAAHRLLHIFHIESDSDN
jgi:hypothetical protein